MKLALKVGNYNINPPGGVPTGGESQLDKIVQTGINLFFIIAVAVALLYLIWGGFDWLRSEGDKTKVQNAKNRVLYSIIGLCVVFASFLIISFLGDMFGVKTK